jgi:hypothetical protein
MRAFCVFAFAALAGCGSASSTDNPADAGLDSGDVFIPPPPPPPPPQPSHATVANGVASWELPRPENLSRRASFLLPWPSDLARTPSGKVDLTYAPDTGNVALFSQYIRTFNNQLDGFSTNGAVYFRFGSAVDPASLPMSGDASRRGESTLQLVDIDPASPQRGTRIPVQWYFREASTSWWPARTLAVAPVFGFPLRPHTRYALVVTTGLRALGGATFTRDRDLESVLSTDASDDPVVVRARELHAPALTVLEDLGVARSQVLSLAVFTTLDPTIEFFRAADWLRRSGPEPALMGELRAGASGINYSRLTGHYGPNPVFQSGATPYNQMGSGGFVLDAQGTPQVQGMENIRFALTIPTTPMPQDGYPIAIYAHGTGGDYQTFINDGSAFAAAGQDVAMIGFDQVFHGERAPAGTSPDTAFFNFANPEAGRTNNRQAGLDLVQCGRFVRNLTFSIQRDGRTEMVRFNPQRVMFFGHSQGGLNGPLWLAAESGAHAAVLSGAAGVIMLSLVLKTRPINIAVLLSQLLQLQPNELVPLHPVMTVLQLLVDPADPVNYGRYIIREPREGMRARHVFMTQGFVDSYAPPPGIAALALSIGVPLTEPVLHPQNDFGLTGLAVMNLPARNNLTLAAPGTAVTAAWMQFDAATGRDGHFVVFNDPGARLRAAAFLGSAGADPAGVPTVPAMLPGMVQ